MSWFCYVRDRLPGILWKLLAMVMLSVFLLSVGNTLDTVFFIALVWLIMSALRLTASYAVRKKYLAQLLDMSENLEEKYLISQVMKKPGKSEDQVFYNLLKQSGRSMLETIGRMRKEQKEYREYMEQWVHEVKNPITAMKLLCENHKSDINRGFLAELEKVNHYVEQTLYYARSEHTEKDYLVRETELAAMIHQAIAENKQQLLQNGVQIQLHHCEATAYTDEKWMVFVLSQLIGNAVKYRKAQPVICFEARQTGDRVALTVCDNGRGIPADDLPRIFDKGFTGHNGRENQNATGIGLYLCRRLCDRLGVELCAASKEGATTFTLTFYRNHFVELKERQFLQ